MHAHIFSLLSYRPLKNGAAAIGLAYAFNYPVLWPVGLIACAYFIHTLYNATRIREVAVNALWFGIVFFSVHLWWFWHAFPLHSSGIDNDIVSFIVVLFAWQAVSVTLALSFVLLGVLFWVLKQHSWQDAPLLASLWIVVEIVRSLLFWFLTFAHASFIGPHFTFGYVGYTLVGSPWLLQLASVGGVYLLSGMYIVGAWLLYKLYVTRRTGWIVTFLGLVITLSFPFPEKHIEHSEGKIITALKTSFPSTFSTNQKLLFSEYSKREALLREALREVPETNIVLFPEDSRFIQYFQHRPEYRQAIDELISGTTHIVDSARTTDHSLVTTSDIYTYSVRDGVDRTYTKILLVPGGEYLPLSVQSLLNTFGAGKYTAKFQQTKDYERGDNFMPTHINSESYAVSLCSEIHSPLIQRELARNTSVILNLASHARFNGSPALFNQIVAMSRVRAVENGKYLVRAGNFSDAVAISNRGEIIATTNPDVPFDFMSVTVPLQKDSTPFSKAPLAVTTLSFLWLLVAMGMYIRRRDTK